MYMLLYDHVDEAGTVHVTCAIVGFVIVASVDAPFLMVAEPAVDPATINVYVVFVARPLAVGKL